MAAIKSLNFLPEIFQSDINKKFLSATIDQLISEPDFVKVNGYIGRRFAPTYKPTDNYIPEPSDLRQQYQLEPAVVIKDANTDSVNLFSSYDDLLNKIQYYGGIVNNHDRLFSNEFYNFDGHFDFDKFVNFNNYYWLPNGPDAVDVFSGAVATQLDYDVTRNISATGYNFSENPTETNPVLVLARGGTYRFNVNQPGSKFWIQSEPGISGTKASQSNISVRDVFGITNNGTETGSVLFRVPLATAQDRFTNMELVASVDFAISYSYLSVQNQPLSAFLEMNPAGFDGTTSGLENKSLIFINDEIDDEQWTDPEQFDSDLFASETARIIPKARRRGLWNIRLEQSNGETIIKLDPGTEVSSNQKVFIRSGQQHATKEFYVDFNEVYSQVPLITAPIDRLYYQDSTNPNLIGEIRIVDQNNYKIDVDNDIIGSISYTSPNKVAFTNGLKVKFDSQVTPSTYANKEYYVEGVGESIVLVPADKLVTPELVFDEVGTSRADYLTINRNSMDYNAWSRSNRWFHIDVLKATASYNNYQELSSSLQRATRPIIEFDGNLQLFNSGRVAATTVDLLDFTFVTDAFSDVEGQLNFELNGTELQQGQRIIFANDSDMFVRNKVYEVNFVEINNQTVIHLVEDTSVLIQPYNCVIVLNGVNKGLNYWYNGVSWIKGQLKTNINQAPLFDVITEDEVSIGDLTSFVNSSFTGTKIFSYSIGTGTSDSVLGFPLKYKNFNSVGDIEFTNNFDTDEVTYLDASNEIATDQINSKYLRKNLGLTEFAYKNIWVSNKEKSKQYQIISKTYDGTTNYFEIDITPKNETTISYTKVFVNNTLIKTPDYSYVSVGVRQTIRISSSLLTKGDKVDILIYSNETSKMGYYQVPSNLDFNAKNENFSELTLGQIRNHVKTLEENTKLIANTPGNFTSLRDIRYKTNGGSILQHSSPLIYANLFLTDKTLNFVDSVDLASKEYSKFKNKFLELASKLSNVDNYSTAELVDELLKNINSIKNITFPWYYSDMLPYGDNKQELVDTVINPNIKQFDLPSVFNDATLSNRAVLVYLNDIQLIKNIDYYFPQDRSAVILTEKVTLSVGDTVKIIDYFNTDGCFVPETPTKLGLYPKATPRIYVDDTYRTPQTIIEGHDGSKTVAFGDFRDNLLLELEKRIYNNIKVDYNVNIFELYNFLPGKFRETAYSLAEFTQILSKSFLKWAGFNKVDFTTNEYYSSNDPWTWNYKKFKDTVDGEDLPGTWRAIYNYFYDTERPHTNPWEMLGFSEEPSWWKDRYGPAPYTGGNLLLWTDLSQGYIHSGNRAGYDTRFARPDLLKIIPVDDYGYLRAPSTFAVKNFDSISTNTSFSIGTQGPVETAWRRSSDYAFALQKALALSSPGYYFGSLINSNKYYKNTNIDQLIDINNQQRITPNSIVINGDTTNSVTPLRSAGYLNWIRDHLRNLGIDPNTKIREYLTNLDVNLGYKAAGYTDKNYIKVLAEQSSPTSTNDSVIIPDENIHIHLNKSAPIKKVIYSGVIIERSDNGYTVSGYDLSTPYFTIIPSLANNNAYAIEIFQQRGVIYKDFQNKKVTVPYGFEFNSRQQVVDFLVSYGRYLTGQGFQFNEMQEDLKEQKDWVLSAKEFLAWSQQGWSSGNIIVLSPAFDSLKLVTNLGVVDAIENSQRSSKILDQNFSIIKTGQLEVTRLDNQFKLRTIGQQTICLAELDVVQYEHVVIFDNATVFNDIIYKPELGNRQYRLKLIGNKTGSWTGVLNPPGFIYNKPTVDEWVPGKDYKKGEIVKYKELYYTALSNIIATTDFDVTSWQQIDKGEIKSGLLPNFSYNAQKFNNIYDIDNSPIDEELKKYSNGLIGFRNRDYLNDFSLEETSQAKFYQGFIKEKGTVSAINSLTSATFNNITSEIDVYEEWAIRVGEYGAIESDQILEFELSEVDFSRDPAACVFLNNNDSVDINESDIVGIKQNTLYKKPTIFKTNIFYPRTVGSNYANDILTAGYVNLNDVNHTIFDFNDYANLDTTINNLGKGQKIWVAKDFDQSWNVYRVTETNNNVISISYNLDNLMLVNFAKSHNLQTGEIFVIKNLDSRFNGFYKVYSVDDLNTVVVEMHKNADILKEARTVSGNGIFYSLSSMRLDNLLDLDSRTPSNGWIAGDKVWADTVDLDGRWGVYEKTDAWQLLDVASANPSEYTNNDNFGYTVKASQNNNLIVIGSPGNNSGNVKTFTRVADKKYIQTSTIKPLAPTVLGFGKSVDVTTDVIAIGAPNSNSNAGYVFLYDSTGNSTGPKLQVLVNQNAESNNYFGDGISLSGDNTWLYVGEPGQSLVYAYKRMSHGIESYTNSLLVNNTDTTYTLYKYETFKVTATSQAEFETVDTPVSGGYILVDNILIDSTEYSISGNTVTFDIPLVENQTVTIATGLFTPVETSSITVEGNSRRYIPFVDYVVSGNTIEFVEPPLPAEIESELLVVSQGTYYKLVNSIYHESESNTGFGSVIESNNDGTDLVISAPTHEVDGVAGAGAVYSFSRRFETIRSRTGISTFIPTINMLMPVNYQDFDSTDWLTNPSIEKTTDYTTILIDGIEQIPGVDYTIVDNSIIEFTIPPESGKLIKVSTALFDRSQEIYNPDPQVLAGFGTSISVNKFGSAVYISAPRYNEVSYHYGKVYRYIDQGKYLGSVSSTEDASVSVGDGIMVNGFNVIFTGTTLADVAQNINDTNIPGVTATVLDNILTVSSQSKVSRNKLEIHTNGSGGYTSLGLTEFVLDQTIKNKNTDQGEIFGTCIKVNDNDETLLITSDRGTTYKTATFDKYSTKSTDVLYVVSNNNADRVAILESVFETKPEWISFASQSLTEITDDTEKTFVNDSALSLSNRVTTYDSNSTQFIDKVRLSGSVYVYELIENSESSILNTGSWLQVQQLSSPVLEKDDQFGFSLDINSDVIIIGSPMSEVFKTTTNTSGIVNGGLAHIYLNEFGSKSWSLISQETDKVDIDSINRLFVYNKETHTILDNLDYIDPAKGKILGIAEQDIDFKTSTDPAQYNAGNWQGLNYNPDFHWSELQVGTIWWDVSKVRYIDYEQDTLTYRIKNWGLTFPGSKIEICEWIESSVPPSQYNSSDSAGYPKYQERTAYVESRVVDDETGIIRVKYYFWVKDKTSSTSITKLNSPTKIANIIEYPQLQNIPYATALRGDSIGFTNIKNLIQGDDSVMHIDYAHIKNTNSIHTEYELVQENRGESIIPTRIFNKLIDSLAGQDGIGNVVPDPTLNQNEALGINIRPRQTMIKYRYVALKNFVDYINGVFKKYPIVNQFNISKMYDSEPLPSSDEYSIEVQSVDELAYIDISNLPTWYKVLVRSDASNDGLWAIYYLLPNKTFAVYKIQAYRTDLYWEKITWYANNYDPSTKVTYTVNTESDISKISLVSGDIIKVRYNQQGYFSIYRVTSALTLEVVGIENGTIKLLPSLHNGSLSGNRYGYGSDGFSTSGFDSTRFDKNPGIEIRKIIEAIQSDIFINELKPEFNKLFFSLMHYILTEQKNVDWIFKTSFISLVHKLRKLEQFPSFIKDNQDYYIDYINEVKPYRTQIREYLLDYSGDDTFAGDVTDFDLPAYYDKALDTFRSPSGELATDATLLTSSKYRNWANNYAYQVTDIIIGDSGNGYTIEPIITITGGGGSGATARALIDSNGKISSVVVTNAGSGYTSSPVVLVNGNGTGARLSAKLGNSKARHFNSTIKFDRISYESTIPVWTANTSYDVGTIVSYQYNAYEVIPSSYVELSGNISVDLGDILYQANTLSNTSSNTARVIQTATLKANILVEPLVGTFATSNANLTIINGDTTTGFYPTAIESITNIPGNESFEFSRYRKLDGNDVGSTADRISVYYKPTSGLSGNNVSQLINGVSYPGVRVTGETYYLDWNSINDWSINNKEESALRADVEESLPYFAGNGNIKPTVRVLYNGKIYEKTNSGEAPAPVTGGNVLFDENLFTYVSTHAPYDSIITSRYLDSTLGTKPEDINIAGGAYVDTFNSHAPEELVPGVTFDTLNMQVFSKLPEGITMGFRISTTPDFDFEQSKFVDVRDYHRISDEFTTTLVQDLYITDSNIYVEDSSKLTAPDPVLARPGVVYINGEKITYYYNSAYDREQYPDGNHPHVLGQIRRGVDQTGAPLLHTTEQILTTAVASLTFDSRLITVDSISGIQKDSRVEGTNIDDLTYVEEVFANSRVLLNKMPLDSSVNELLTFICKCRVVDSSLIQSIPGNADGTSWGSAPLWLSNPASVIVTSDILNVTEGDIIQQFVSNVVNTSYFSGVTWFDALPYDATNFEQSGEIIETLVLHANARVISNSVINGTQVIGIIPEVVEITNELGETVNNTEFLEGDGFATESDPLLGELLYLTRNKMRVIKTTGLSTTSNTYAITYSEINSDAFISSGNVPTAPDEFDPWQKSEAEVTDGNTYNTNTAYVYVDGEWHFLSTESTSGLDISTEPQVVFLKQKPSFTP
jgi:hypothetical protein